MMRLFAVLAICIPGVTNANAEEPTTERHWVRVLAAGKGDDYLFVLDESTPSQPPRRLTCQTSLPSEVEDLAEVAAGIDCVLIAMVSGQVHPWVAPTADKPQGPRVIVQGYGRAETRKEERIADLKIYAMCLIRKENISAVVRGENRDDVDKHPIEFPEPSDPFEFPEPSDPFGASPN